MKSHYEIIKIDEDTYKALNQAKLFKRMRERTGMTLNEFATYFCIPQRTIEDWEAGKRTPPVYIYNLLYYTLWENGKIE